MKRKATDLIRNTQDLTQQESTIVHDCRHYDDIDYKRSLVVLLEIT